MKGIESKIRLVITLLSELFYFLNKDFLRSQTTYKQSMKRRPAGTS